MSPSATPFRNLALEKFSWSTTIAATLILALAGQCSAIDKPKTGTISSCTNGQCTNCTIGNDASNKGDSSWGLSNGYPSCEVYTSATFAGAESKQGSGYDVFWNLGEPNEGCKIIVMSPVGQDVAGANCGNVVLAEAHAGCYYTHLEDTFMTQFCCGVGDCAAAGAGGAKRSVHDIPSLMARAADGSGSFAVPMTPPGSIQPVSTFSLKDKHTKRAAASLDTSRGLGLTARATKFASALLHPRKDPICGPSSNVGDPYTKAAGQQQITNVLSCNSNDNCNQQVSKQVSVAHSITSSESHTFTLSAGISVSVKAGVDFIVDAEATAEGHADIANAVEKSTGVTDTKTVSTTVNQVYSQVPGTKGYIWFTPTLNCQKKALTCAGEDMTVEQCDPALLGDGSQKGELGFTTSD